MDIFVFFLLSSGMFWGISIALDRFFDEKQCPSCGQWTNARHMIEHKPDNAEAKAEYWHARCFLLRHPGDSPHPDSK